MLGGSSCTWGERGNLSSDFSTPHPSNSGSPGGIFHEACGTVCSIHTQLVRSRLCQLSVYVQAPLHISLSFSLAFLCGFQCCCALQFCLRGLPGAPPNKCVSMCICKHIIRTFGLDIQTLFSNDTYILYNYGIILAFSFYLLVFPHTQALFLNLFCCLLPIGSCLLGQSLICKNLHLCMPLNQQFAEKVYWTQLI